MNEAQSVDYYSSYCLICYYTVLCLIVHSCVHEYKKPKLSGDITFSHVYLVRYTNKSKAKLNSHTFQWFNISICGMKQHLTMSNVSKFKNIESHLSGPWIYLLLHHTSVYPCQPLEVHFLRGWELCLEDTKSKQTHL